MTTKTKPQIKSFRVFKECIRKGEIEQGFGKIIKFYSLYYGFTHDISIKGVSNLKDAYKQYKEFYYHYDKFVAPNSFLKL